MEKVRCADCGTDVRVGADVGTRHLEIEMRSAQTMREARKQ